MSITNDTPETTPAALLNRFTRQFAHELGNPVASIRLSAEMLQDDISEEMRRELLGIVLSESTRLERLIQRAVYFTSIGEPKQNDTSIETIVEAAVRQVAESFPVDVDLGNFAGSVVRADVVQLTRVLYELLINAKQSGATRVSVTADRREASVLLLVCDDGEGMNPDATVKALELFHSTRDAQLGIGLNIARGIIESHGGTLGIGPGHHAGTIVTLALQIIS